MREAVIHIPSGRIWHCESANDWVLNRCFDTPELEPIRSLLTGSDPSAREKTAPLQAAIRTGDLCAVTHSDVAIVQYQGRLRRLTVVVPRLLAEAGIGWDDEVCLGQQDPPDAQRVLLGDWEAWLAPGSVELARMRKWQSRHRPESDDSREAIGVMTRGAMNAGILSWRAAKRVWREEEAEGLRCSICSAPLMFVSSFCRMLNDARIRRLCPICWTPHTIVVPHGEFIRWGRHFR